MRLHGCIQCGEQAPKRVRNANQDQADCEQGLEEHHGRDQPALDGIAHAYP